MNQRGHIGHYEDTDTPCPYCAAEGRKTLGGYTPTLKRKAGTDELWCLGTAAHGRIEGNE